MEKLKINGWTRSAASTCIIFFAHAYSKSLIGGDIILIIEEPESHLHPLAQQWLANTINKMASDGLQIILTTHSPYFVNLEALQGINIVRKSEEGTYIITSER
ncbi:MAG: AAA family ATPase [Balneolaceae bacterium]|nr:AAA family ATPase [Balneolaceae bacterium]